MKKSPQKLIFFSSPPLRWVHTTWSRYNGARQANQKSNQIKHGIKITTTTINYVWLGAITTAHRSSSHSSHEEAYLLSQTCASRQANAIHTCDASIIPIFNGSAPPSYLVYFLIINKFLIYFSKPIMKLVLIVQMDP